MKRRRILAARSDSMGDLLLTGPALRALGTGGEVVLLCGPRGLEAARMLPGLERIVCAELPWIDPEPTPVKRAAMIALLNCIAGVGADEAVIFTSFHQSPLPLALLMRMAGVARITAICEDYPGSLLDVRHRDPGDVHEVERALSVARAAGYTLPAFDDGSLLIDRVDEPPPEVAALTPYAIVHPGASVPARMWPVERSAALVPRLRAAGLNVVVTGGRGEQRLTRQVARGVGLDRGGRLTLRELAAVIAGAEVVVVPNTGPAHLAAAVGTPVVSLFAPVVSAVRWGPWRVPHVLLGDQDAPCARSRARVCPVEGHPCLASVSVEDVARAAEALAGARQAA